MRLVLKLSAIVANVGVLIWAARLLSSTALSGSDRPSFFLVVVATPVLSLCALLATSRADESWLALLLRRKAAEERRKIKELEGDSSA